MWHNSNFFLENAQNIENKRVVRAAVELSLQNIESKILRCKILDRKDLVPTEPPEVCEDKLASAIGWG